jgi:ABC-type dipeptide/oligopeptide/nickel transport system permease subunit
MIALASTLIACAIGGAVGIVAGYYEGTEGLRIPWLAVVAAVAAIVLVIAGVPYVAAGAVVVGAVVWLVSAAVKPLQVGPRLNLDTALMRAVDIGLSFPFLLLVMAIGAALDTTTAVTILVTLGTARVVRAKTLQVRSLDFIVASRALGQSTAKILVYHVLPNVAGPLIVIGTVSVAQMILAESVLSYLGVGLSPPAPTWGHMLFEGQDYYQAAPWLIVAPGAAILVAVFGFNLLGEGLRDALDPKED